MREIVWGECPQSGQASRDGEKILRARSRRGHTLEHHQLRDCPLADLPMLEILRQTSETVFVPLTIGGGIRDKCVGTFAQIKLLETMGSIKAETWTKLLVCERRTQQTSQPILKKQMLQQC